MYIGLDSSYLDTGRYIQQRVSHPQENTFNLISKMCQVFVLSTENLLKEVQPSLVVEEEASEREREHQEKATS